MDDINKLVEADGIKVTARTELRMFLQESFQDWNASTSLNQSQPMKQIESDLENDVIATISSMIKELSGGHGRRNMALDFMGMTLKEKKYIIWSFKNILAIQIMYTFVRHQK